MAPLLQAAQWYAAHGLHVFPLRPDYETGRCVDVRGH